MAPFWGFPSLVWLVFRLAYTGCSSSSRGAIGYTFALISVASALLLVALIIGMRGDIRRMRAELAAYRERSNEYILSEREARAALKRQARIEERGYL